ncbi:MAG: type III-B CRISPR module RAMP protein Cmr6 [candidate division WOR-3 bacterium]|nr:type III-B CRISPR module RAMP protein Cmr6 [candidate division WOR-3 bacterium]
MSIQFSRDNKYLPSDTYRIISSIGVIQNNQYGNYNFYYIFNLPQIVGDPPEKIRIRDEIEKFRWDTNTLTNIEKRVDKIVNSLSNSGLFYVELLAECKWRLIIGLGASHPQETSMTLHHIYGIPYIPGSAVKGVTRHWSIRKFADQVYQTTKQKNQTFEEILKELSKALENGEDNIDIEINGIRFSDLIQIFGTQRQAGKVIFMDAYPVEDIKLAMDIMNVHYSDYYSGDEPPADWQTPVPIKFLTVEKTKFKFIILSRNEVLLSKAEKLLKEALEYHGIGAKTSLGYGIFSI